MSTVDPVRRATGSLAGIYVGKRNGRVPDPAKITEARRNLNAAYVERAILKALDSAPPLSDEQRRTLAALLVDGGGSR